jgi:hypothetical protein
MQLLAVQDPTVLFEPFNGNSTFKKCNNIPFYNFKFNNQTTTPDNNASYNINWGDGSPDTTFTTWPADIVINHTFKIGSNTMTVSVTGKDGCVGIKKYIVFLGQFRPAVSPALVTQIFAHPIHFVLRSLTQKIILPELRTHSLLMMVQPTRYSRMFHPK